MVFGKVGVTIPSQMGGWALYSFSQENVCETDIPNLKAESYDSNPGLMGVGGRPQRPEAQQSKCIS